MDPNQKESLTTLLRHSEVNPYVNLGLSGHTLIDHVIGLVLDAYKEFPEDKILATGEDLLKELYPTHFKRGEYDKDNRICSFHSCIHEWFTLI